MIYFSDLLKIKEFGQHLDFLRTPSGEYDPNYVLNQAECHNYFYDMIRNFNSKVSFIDILIRQHQIACLGKKGMRSYKIKDIGELKKMGKIFGISEILIQDN